MEKEQVFISSTDLFLFILEKFHSMITINKDMKAFTVPQYMLIGLTYIHACPAKYI
jgi:hypothetical protein